MFYVVVCMVLSILNSIRISLLNNMLLESTTKPSSNNRRIQVPENQSSESPSLSTTCKPQSNMSNTNTIKNNAIQNPTTMMTDSSTNPVPSVTCKARNQLFQLGFEMGNLCQKILTCAPPFDPQIHAPYHEASLREHEPFWSSLHEKENGNSEEETHDRKKRQDDDVKKREEVYGGIRALFQALVVFCDICDINLTVAIVKKMELNGKKYPVELCKVCVVLCDLETCALMVRYCLHCILFCVLGALLLVNFRRHNSS